MLNIYKKNNIPFLKNKNVVSRVRLSNSFGAFCEKIKLEDKPAQLIEKIIEEFKFETPKKLPKICSLISGYFSYDSIRYIEKIPNKCKNDINLTHNLRVKTDPCTNGPLPHI